MNTEILEEIGLTRSEIKVFLTALELGATSAGPIVEKSGVQNAVVHRSLHSLIEKGLITYIYEGKIKQYQAADPKLLLDLMDERRKKLENLLPKLKEKKELARAKAKATIFQGTRGVKQLLYSMLDTDSKNYAAYGGSHSIQKLLGDHFWSSFHYKRIELEKKGRIIFHQSLKWWGKSLGKRKLTNLRYTKKDFDELTETFVCGNKVGIIIATEKPFGFLIEDESAATAYMQYFEIIWNECVP